jgi:hypothetical protein
MYLIKTCFKSNIAGIYRIEEETVEIEYKDMKIKQRLERWLNILCPYVNSNSIDISNTEFVIELINLQIKKMNNDNDKNKINFPESKYERCDCEFKFEVIEN